jgi:phosphate starvation-inducible PhoH-like protein
MSKKKRTAKAAAVVSPVSSTETKDNSPYVFQRDKINYSLNIRELPWTDKQKEIINLFLDKKTKVLFLKGVAGTSKTTLAMYCGLQLLNNHRVSDLVLIRSAVESADSKMGYLPGTIDEKFGVYLAPFNDKFTELLPKPQIDKLEKDNRIVICPINYARGLHFAVKFVCCDEAQNLTVKEVQTMMTRLGEFCKVIICGDPEQSDLPYGKSGFMRVFDAFNTPEAVENGIMCRELGEEDIVRSELCKFIVHKFKDINIARQLEESKKKGS